MTAALVLFLFSCGAALPSLPAQIGEPLNSSAAVGVTSSLGNGGLTVGLNEFGMVTVCRWPSPSYFGQLRAGQHSPGSPRAGLNGGGLMWGLRASGETSWLDGAPWTASTRYLSANPNVVETLMSLPDSAMIAKQKWFVCPDRDVLVTQLRVYDAKSPLSVYWYAGFDPCTRLIPEAPFLESLLGQGNGFAVFADAATGTVYHFRPQDPGQKDWQHARRLVKSGTTLSEWSSFPDGVWIAYRGNEPVSEFQCGNTGDASSALRQAGSGELSGTAGAVGQCNSAVEWDFPETGSKEFSVALLVSFGRSYAETKGALDAAAKAGYEQLVAAHQQYWTRWLGQARLPSIPDAEIREIANQCLIVLANAMDRNTGAIVSGFQPETGTALDWTRSGAWITSALDAAGFPELAEKHTMFYADCVRKQSTAGKPAGSLPVASYGNHVDGTPHVALDVEGSAWTLWSFWNHASHLSEGDRMVYLKKIWDVADLAGDFVSGWVDDRSGEPLPSFSADRWRDERSDGELSSMLAGLVAATHIAQALGHERPNWTERMKLMRSSAQYRFLNANQTWKIEDPISNWPAEVVALEDPRWDAPAEAAMKALPGLDGERAAASLCDLAWVCKARPERLEHLRPLVKSALTKALTQAVRPDAATYPDPLTAARCLVTIEVVFDE